MKFVKGMIVGSIVSAGIAMLYAEGMMNKKQIMKKGKRMARKMGMNV